MKKFIVIFLIFQFLLIGNPTSAQSTGGYSIELIENKDWFIIFGESERDRFPAQGIHMANNVLTSFGYINNTRKELKAQYYLSDTPDKTFISSKVGKYTKGKYLIIKDSSGLMCAKIIGLTKVEMVLHCYWTNRQLSFTTKRPN